MDTYVCFLKSNVNTVRNWFHYKEVCPLPELKMTYSIWYICDLSMYANRVFGQTLYYANFELSSDSSLSHRLRNITSVLFCSGLVWFVLLSNRRPKKTFEWINEFI